MTDVVRIGVVGLGHMGRHHARVASRVEGAEFVGGADPAGDPYLALGRYPSFPSLEALLETSVDAVVLATPPASHEKAAVRLAEAGVHTLIEKPLAADIDGARAIRDAFGGNGIVASVGHVERFNPALQEMKRRLDTRCLGRVFAISTKRTGPLPLRRQDIGVVHDLASHDIDIVHWLVGSFRSLRSHVAHHLDPVYEDLVEAIGLLEDGTVVSMSVNWLTPAKERQVTVLGERGALVADLLTSDLTFYSNSAIPVEWDELAHLKGVSEGDITTYAIRKVEPLQLEVEGFIGAVKREPGSQIVTLDDGVRVMEIAEAMRNGGIG